VERFESADRLGKAVDRDGWIDVVVLIFARDLAFRVEGRENLFVAGAQGTELRFAAVQNGQHRVQAAVNFVVREFWGHIQFRSGLNGFMQGIRAARR
jgi:hypothetical protein